MPAAAELTHPFLAFDAEDVPALRQRLTAQPYSTWMERVRQSAIAGLSFTPGGTDEQDQSAYAMDLAFAWLMDQDRRYLKKATALLRHIGDFDTDWKTFGWVWGGDLLRYAYAYDFAQPALTPEENAAILVKMSEAVHKTIGIFPHTSGFRYWVNVRLRVSAGAGAAALAMDTYGTAPAWADYVEEELFGRTHKAMYPRYVNTCVTEEGTYNEGPSYQNDSLSALLPYLLIVKRLTGRDYINDTGLPAGRRVGDRLAKMFMRNAALTMPDHAAATFATGWRYGFSLAQMAAPAIGGGGGPQVQWFYAWLNGTGFSDGDIFDILYTRPDLSRRPPSYLSLVTRDWSSFRSSWQPDALYFLMQSEYWPVRSTHASPDQTSFLLYAKRQYLLIDPGDGRHYRPTAPEKEEWINKDPEAHNLVIVDGRVGSDPGRQAPARVYDYRVVRDPAVLQAAFDSDELASSMIHMEYANVPDVSTRRTAVMARRSYIVVFDNMVCSASEVHTYDAQLHFGGPAGSDGAVRGTLTTATDRITWTTTARNGNTVTLDCVYSPPPQVIIRTDGAPTDYDVSGRTFTHTFTKARFAGATEQWLNLLYPRDLTSGDPAPAISSVRVDGGRGAAATVALSASGIEDLAIVSNGAAEVTAAGQAGSFRGQAALFLRTRGAVEQVTAYGARVLRARDRTILLASVPVHADVFLDRDQTRADLVVPGAESAKVAIRASGSDAQLHLDGVPVAARYDPSTRTLSTTVPAGTHTLSVQ